MAATPVRAFYLILAALAVLVLVAFGQVPGDTRLSQVIQNAAHGPAFFAIALIVLAGVRVAGVRGRFRPPPGVAWPYIATFAICILLGAGIECLQALIGSDASLQDIATDGLGSVAGLTGVAYLKTRKKTRLAVCLVSMGVVAAPVVQACAAYVNRAMRFPAIAVFHSPLDLYFFKRQTPSLRITPPGLWVRLPAQDWPGVALEEPAPDWSGYRTLVAEFDNPQDRALSLVIRVHDRAHNQALDDRYNRRFEVPARGVYRLSIPLADIETAPRGRRMQMTHIAGVIVFGDAKSAGRSFYLRKIALE